MVDPIPDDVSRLATLAWTLCDAFPINSTLKIDAWSLAEDIQQRNTKLRTEYFFEDTLSMPVLFRSTQSIAKLCGQRPSMLAYTNIGNCSWLNSCGNQTRVTFALPLTNKSLQGTQFWILASTVEQRMCVTIAFPSHVATMDDARAFLQRSVDVMVEACV